MGTLSYQYLSIAYCFTQCLALEEMGTRKNKLDEMGVIALGEEKKEK